MQLLYVVVFALVAACGSKDKCERVTDKLEPLIKESGKPYDRAKALEKCHADLERNPKAENMLDCILALPDPVTGPTLIRCANTDKYGPDRR